MKLTSLMNIGDPWAQRSDYELFLETHLSYLQKNAMSVTKEVTDDVGEMYKGDFFGLLSVLGVGVDMHYIVMRVNGFTSSMDYDGSPMLVKTIRTDELARLGTVFRTNNQKK